MTDEIKAKRDWLFKKYFVEFGDLGDVRRLAYEAGFNSGYAIQQERIVKIKAALEYAYDEIAENMSQKHEHKIILDALEQDDKITRGGE